MTFQSLFFYLDPRLVLECLYLVMTNASCVWEVFFMYMLLVYTCACSTTAMFVAWLSPIWTEMFSVRASNSSIHSSNLPLQRRKCFCIFSFISIKYENLFYIFLLTLSRHSSDVWVLGWFGGSDRCRMSSAFWKYDLALWYSFML